MKHLQVFYNKCAKGTLAIEMLSYVRKGNYYLTDGEFCVIVPTDLPDGAYHMFDGELKKAADLTGDEVGSMDSNTEQTADIPFTLSMTDQLNMLNVFMCTADDELRPLMNQIYFDTANAIMVASDAHILRCETITSKEAFPLLVSRGPVDIVSRMIKHNKAKCVVSRWGNRLKFDWGASTLVLRECDGRYPQYQHVIPDYTGVQKAFMLHSDLVKKIAKQLRAYKEKQGTSYLYENEILIRDPNGVTEERYPIHACKTPQSQFGSVLMPMYPGTESWSPETDPVFMVSFKSLERLIAGYKGELILGFTEKSKAIGVWKQTAKVTKKETTPTAVKPKALPPQKASTPEPVEAEVVEEVTEQPAPAQAPKAATPKAPAKSKKPKQPAEPLTLIDYSEKAVAVIGDAKELKEKFKELHGRFNRNLTVNGEKKAGWIFSKKRRMVLELLLKVAA